MLVDEMPPAVAAGKTPGFQLQVRLERTVARTPEKVRIECAVTQAIFDLKLRALRGSATQRGALELGPKVDDAGIARQVRACMNALVPVVHDGMTDFVGRLRR
ncbi:MAG: hypothetical protein KC620_16175, partial [Myxococcales bacterium]|nr:hypothetical protein [Myxococcales bacterium]